VAKGDVKPEPGNKRRRKVTGKAKRASRKRTPPETEQKGKKKNYHIDIFHAWCKQCGICVAFCPVEVLSHNDAGYPYAKKPESCTGCMQCELRCPDFAITVLEDVPSRKEQPSHGVESVGGRAAVP